MSPPAVALPEPEFWLWQGHRVAWTRKGSAGAPNAVVLIHGFGASLGHWLSSSHDHGPSPLFRRPTRATLLRKSGTSSIDRAPLFGRVGGTRGRTTPP